MNTGLGPLRSRLGAAGPPRVRSTGLTEATLASARLSEGRSIHSVRLIEFDLNGRKLTLDEGVVRMVRAKARAGAGSSTALNDLAVILDRALADRKPVTLRRAEARALERLL